MAVNFNLPPAPGHHPFGGDGEKERKLSVWETDVFTADMCESLVRGHDSCYAHYAEYMRDSLESMLSRNLSDAARTSLIRMIHALQRSETIYTRMQQYREWRIPFHMARIVDSICKQLHASSVGDVHVMPFYCKSNSVMVIHHERTNTFHAAVINVEPLSTEYLPSSADRPPKLLMQTVLELHGVAKSRITSEAFWSTCLLADDASDEAMYTHLIPWLNQKTLGEIIDDTAPNFATGSKTVGGNLWKSFVHALKFVMRRADASVADMKCIRVFLKRRLLETVREELGEVADASHSTKLILNAALQNAALSLARNASNVPANDFDEVRLLIDAINARVEALPCPDLAVTKPPPQLDLEGGWEKLQQPHLFPMMECFRRLEDVESFIGVAVEQPRVVPINFLRIPTKGHDFSEALTILEDAVRLCTRMTTQLSVVKHGAQLICSLLTNVFLDVLPTPLGPKSAKEKKCLWNVQIRYGQQMQCLRLLWNCTEFFMFASFSCSTTREFDSQRIVILGAISTIADAVARLLATDHPSIVSKHLRGYRRKPAFAPTVGKLAPQTENSLAPLPQVVERRCAVLDYFQEVHDEVPTGNAMWQFENNMDFCKATQILLVQICRFEGIAVNPSMKFFTDMSSDTTAVNGVKNIFGRYFPELRYLRDIMLCYKWTMAPRSRLPQTTFPPGCHLEQLYRAPAMTAYVNNRKLAAEYMAISIMPRATVLRYPSMTIASRFTAPFDGTTEDDILHVKNLPTFDEAMGQRDSELLLSYLTSPYIRLPLVLNFFAVEDRISCLGNQMVRNVLEAVVFEPGRFLTAPRHDLVPVNVPSDDGDLLATPMGFLANELQFSPDGVMTPVLRLVKLAREMDAGTVHNMSVVEIIMFLVRLVARVGTYARHLLAVYDDADRHERCRGIVMKPDDAETLRRLYREMRELVVAEFVPMVETWNVEAMSKVLEGSAACIDNATQLSAWLHAHILLLLRDVGVEGMSQEVASMAVSSIMFLTARYTFCTDSLSGIPETELFDVMQVMRHRVVSYLYRCSPTVLCYVFNSAVRVATTTGPRVAASAFPWGCVAGEDCVGRFTRVDHEGAKRPNHDSKRPQLADAVETAFGGTVRLASDATCINEGLQDVEVNINTLLLTFNASHLVALPSEVAMHNDTIDVFGSDSPGERGSAMRKMMSMQCAIVQDAEHRMWVRLVGQEHDVQYWKTEDPRIPLPADNIRFFPDDLTTTEDWIFDVVEPVRRAFFVRSFWEPPIFLLLPEHKMTCDQHVVTLAAVCSKTGKKLKEIVAFRDFKCAHVYEVVSECRHFYRSLVYSSDCHYCLRELQPDVNMRRRMWAPWERHAAGHFNAEETQCDTQQSVAIMRHASHPENVACCTETFIPSRLLFGLIPSALLETHKFWQDADDNIRGYPGDKNATHLLWCHWRDTDFEQIGGDKQTCFRVIRFSRRKEAPKASEAAVLKSQKVLQTDEMEEELDRLRTTTTGSYGEAVEERQEMGMYRESSADHIPPPAGSATVEDYNLILLDLQHARAGTPLHSIAMVLGRIELLSHVLCWTTKVEYEQTEGGTPANRSLSVDLIQLPRLKLQFSAKVDADGTTRLYSLDHAHLFVSNLRQPLIIKLLQGIPHSIVLADTTDSVSILVPAFSLVRPPIESSPFSTELVINRRDKKWYEKLDTRYYLYPVHVSMSFVFTPTLASALYLLALRYLHCEYEDVFKLASTIGTDVEFTPEEKQNFELLRSPDRRPEAFACRCKIGLLVADSPILHLWYLPEQVASMLACSPAISVACRMSSSEERRLLYVCDVLMRKIDVLTEVASATREDVLDTITTYHSRQDIHPSDRKQVTAFMKRVQSRIADVMGIRISKDEIGRLLVLWTNALERSTSFPSYFKCILDNRRAFLEAEAKSIECGEPQMTIYRVPPMGKDNNWKFYRDFDALSAKLPGAQPKVKNDEGREVTLSGVHDYFYCGEDVRKPGTCRCRECGESCGPDGCPCPSCERFNKRELLKLRYIPDDLSSSTMRIMSFYDAFTWIAEVTEEQSRMSENITHSRLPKDVVLTDAGNRAYSLRNDTGSFLQCYECLTGTTKVRIGSSDSAADMISLLFPMYYEARNPVSALGHLMHYLLSNPGVWPKLVKYKRPQGKATTEQRMQDIYSSIMGQAATTCRMPADPPPPREVRTKIDVEVAARPATRPDTTVPLLETRVLPNITDTDMRLRKWQPVDEGALQISEAERGTLGISDTVRGELRGWLLASAVPAEGFLGFFSREELGQTLVSRELPFDLKKHDASRTTVAASMVGRLEADMSDYANQQNTRKAPRIIGLAGEQQVSATLSSAESTTKRIKSLQQLQTHLQELRDKDSKYFITAFTVAERTANAMPVAKGTRRSEAVMHLRRLARQEAVLSLPYLISCLCSAAANDDWKQLNPFLNDDTCQAIASLLTGALLRANRIGHSNRTSEAAKELVGLLEKANCYRGSEEHAALLGAVISSAQQKADALAGLLATKRVYIEEDFTFDPRFLLFEYNWNLVLRSRQRELINEMYDSITADQSIVKQMIMGAGKTTVVGPLLALMLADGQQLVIQVVPPALLDFTRSVLRTTFSCVLQKQIFCFICDRATDVDSEVISKFRHARQSRGIVVTTPSTIKSVYLKLVEGMDRLEDTTRPPIKGLETEVADLHEVLGIWREAVLIMDEVDMLLHPLKSELNFPIGAKNDIDFAPLRWKLPMHLIDAVFYGQLHRISVGMKETPEMTRILADINDALARGIKQNSLQGTPHTTLLNLEFYASEMKVPFAKWLLLFLKAHHFAGLSDEDTLEFVTKRPSRELNYDLNKRIEALEADHIRTLNLGYEWINAFLPHVLQKIDRVSFGIMNGDDMRRAREEHPNMPRSRFVTAIPFVGKDLPSQSSEFAHPDVVIGLTILAYRYEGLRQTDYTEIMRQVHGAVEKEVGRFAQRRTNIMYNRWVQAAGGKLLQNFTYSDKAKGAGGAEDEVGMQPSESMGTFGTDSETREVVGVLPLKLMKQANKDESIKLFNLFKRAPEVIHWYLNETIFPEYMRHQQLKLSASGQELGGDMIFKRRIGFSGTPSDLLPVELGTCEYEKGTDGQLVHTLTSPHVMSSIVVESGWTVRSVLDNIAQASPPFHALIDTGALITGMSNLQVAQYLLKHGLPQMEGVVFLDELDRKMILVRATGRVLKLAECGIPKLKRFAFYDQVHTTGMDIQHAPNAQAVCTLGKDMTFRDFAQGAYRMRGIGAGQTVNVLVIPEVLELIQRSTRSLRLVGDTKGSLLEEVSAWLLLNSIRSEHTQHNQLCLQTISNVWRKEAFDRLKASISCGQFAVNGKIAAPTVSALNVFRENVDYDVATTVPQPRMFSEAIEVLVDGHRDFIVEDMGKQIVNRICQQTKLEDEIDNPVIDVQMVQEQEEERESEQEKEKQQEIELEKFVDLTYSRDEEAAIPWALASLRDPRRATQFYRLSQFHLHKRRPIDFPNNLMLSRNFFNPMWSGYRRIKNAIVTMEWVPSVAGLELMVAPHHDYGAIDTERSSDALATSLQMVRDHEGEITAELLKDFVVVALGHPPEASVVDWPSEIASRRLLDAEVDGVLQMLVGNFLRDEERGRFTVALSLAEAETVRRAIHVRRQRGESLVEDSDTHVQLRIVPSQNLVLDATPGFPLARKVYMQQRNYHCLRFFDGDLNYADAEINLLLRALHPTPEQLRQAFFLQVIACRRRARQRWERSPVSLVFEMKDPLTLLHQKTLGLMMRRELIRRDLHFGDAFIAMNASGSGQLSPDEVWGALRFCRLDVAAADVLDMMQVADTHHEGTLQYPDFISMLTGTADLDDDDEGAVHGGGDLKRLPTVEPHGAEELRRLRCKREELRRRLEREAGEAIQTEHKQIRDELEAERIQEELTQLQACGNPTLGDTNLSYTLRCADLPQLVKFYGSVIKNEPDGQADGMESEPIHAELHTNSGLTLNTRALQLVTGDPILKKYALTIEFRLPNPLTSRGKSTKRQVIDILDDNGNDITLAWMETSVWEFSPQKRRTDRFAAEMDEYDSGDKSDDSSDDDESSYCDSVSYDSYNSDGEEESGIIKFIYSKPETGSDVRLFKLRRTQRLLEDVGKRISTTTDGSSLEWMKVLKPVAGWVIYEENGRRHWVRERLTIHLGRGVLNVRRNTSNELDLERTMAPTVFDLPAKQEDDDPFDFFTQWTFLDSDDSDEEDEEDEEFDMGDIQDLVGALRKAKELSVGDKVSRNPDSWDHGDDDGGSGAVGRVIKVGSNEVEVQWSVGHKASYAWGRNGVFELVKVASADDEDIGREVNQDPEGCRTLLRSSSNPTARCSSCSTNLQLNDQTGWYKCNMCHYHLCRKCFRSQRHDQHEFSDFAALVEELKTTTVICGAVVRIHPSVKQPRLGWSDAPRDGSTGTVISMSEDALGDDLVTVSFSDILWKGYADEVVVVDPKFESYLTTWLGSMMATVAELPEEREAMTALLTVVDESVAPPKVEGIFKPGDKVAFRETEHSDPQLGEVRAVLPLQMYAVSIRNNMKSIEESKLTAFSIATGSRVRLKMPSDGCWNRDPPEGIMAGMVGVVDSVDNRCNLRVTFRTGLRVTRGIISSRDVEVVGKGKWFCDLSDAGKALGIKDAEEAERLARAKEEKMEQSTEEKGEKNDEHKDEKKAEVAEEETADTSAAPTIPQMPNAAQIVMERGFGDGVPSVDVFVKNTTYRARFADMTLRDVRTNEVVGRIERDPKEPWQEHRSVRFDDGKWHVLSIAVGEALQAFCDGKEIAIFTDEIEADDSDCSDFGANDEECEEPSDCEDSSSDENDEPQRIVAKSSKVAGGKTVSLVDDDTADAECDDEDSDENGEHDSADGHVSKSSDEVCDASDVEIVDAKFSDCEGNDASGDPGPSDPDQSGDAEESGCSSDVASWERGTSSSDSDSSDDKQVCFLSKKLHMKPIQAMAVDVRNTVGVLGFTESGVRSKFSQSFPSRHVAHVDVSWGVESGAARNKKLSDAAVAATLWKCADCGHNNSRLDDQCSQCRGERFRVDLSSARQSKVRAVTAWSREAQEIRRKLHAKLRARFQQQLEQFDDVL